MKLKRPRLTPEDKMNQAAMRRQLAALRKGGAG